MLKALIVNSEFKLVTMLYDVQLMTANFKWVLERGAEFLHLEDASAISENLFLATQIAAHELNCD
jgi:hypothetical protein